MYSSSVRNLVLTVYAYFQSMRKTAKACRVSIASICRWTKRPEPKKRGVCKKPLVTDALVASVDIFLRAQTRCSSHDVIEHVHSAWALRISRQLAHCIIRRLGFTWKRTRKRGRMLTTKPRGEEESRSTFFRSFLNAYAAGTLVSIDESGFDQRCKPVYGYAPAGAQAIVNVSPCSDNTRHNLLMALHQAGEYSFDLQAASVNGDDFSGFLEELPFPPGTTLLLDNVSFHKVRRARDVARAKGFDLLFLPPYSPEFNPIELVFGTLKRAFYAERYSSGFGDSVQDAVVGCLMQVLAPEIIKNSFRHVRDLILLEASRTVTASAPDAACCI
jgi:transposase